MNAPVPHLPGEFYASTPALNAVRQAAFARQVSPDAVLAVVLCRVAASLPPGIVLPDGGTLDFVAAVIGSPGTGKSKAMRAGRDLLPDIGTKNDGLPVPTGEGIAAAYVGKVDEDGTNPIVNTSALFYVDEGEQLLTVGRREGSTTLNVIRSCWSGQAFGSMNASTDRRRVVKAGSYRFALCVGFQAKFAAELLTGQDVGDPQRYLFAGVTHPEIRDVPPSFPAPLRLPLTGTNHAFEVEVHPEIAAGIRRRRAAVGRGEVVLDPFDTHRDLLTLKTAALLSFLDGDGDVTPESWRLANAVVDNGRAVRAHLIAASQAQRDELLRAAADRDAAKDAIREESKAKRALRSCARSMIRKAKNEGRPVTRSILTTAVAGQYRNVVDIDDVIAFACEVGTPDDGRLQRDGDYFVHVRAA